MFLPQQWCNCRGGWNKPSSDFSQCVGREQSLREGNYPSFFIIVGITHPLQRTQSRQLWGCRASGPKPAGRSEGVFSGSAKLTLSKLLVLTPAVMSRAFGNRNSGWGNEAWYIGFRIIKRFLKVTFYFLSSIFFPLCWLHHKAYRILVPPWRIEFTPSAMAAWVLTTEPPRNSMDQVLFNKWQKLNWLYHSIVSCLLYLLLIINNDMSEYVLNNS